jgi:hypothetical protein
MAIKNNYWKVLSKEQRHYHTKPGGWDIRLETDHYGKDQKITICIPRECTKEDRKYFRRAFAMDKRIAQSVNTREEYKKLWDRIDPGNWDYIEEHDLKDGNLIHWAYNTRTADEYYRLLRYN